MMRLKILTLAFGVTLIFFCDAAHAEAHSVSLSWTASTDNVAGYNIYRLAGACPTSGSTGFTKITAAIVTGTTYTDSSITPGAYCYYATSTLNGAESAPSNFASAVILPAPPTALSTTGTN